MALTLADLDQLQRAYAAGLHEIEINGELLKFASGADMRQRILWLERQLGVSKPKSTKSVGSFRKGIR